MKDKSVVLPKKRKGDPLLPEDALLIPSSWEFRLSLDYFGLKHKRASRLDFASLYLLPHKTKEIALVGPCIGAPAAVLILEKMIVLGAKNVLVLGCCGSLQEDINIGDMIIPEEAIREEGTSFHYIEDGEFIPRAHKKMTGLISKACEEQRLKIHAGKVWTTDAPYRETRGKVGKYKGQNVLGVEMELSALMTVACLKKINLGGLLIVSDELSSLEWEKGFHSKIFKSSFSKGCEVALRVFERL